MRIEHVAIWCKDLERMKHFYAHFFKAKSNGRYENSTKGFRSYFLTLPDGPRWTGDGYYECVMLDPEWNRVEIVV